MENNLKRLVNIEDFMEYTTLGKNSAMEFGKEIGCAVKIGRRTVYDLKKAEQYFDKLAGMEQEKK